MSATIGDRPPAVSGSVIEPRAITDHLETERAEVLALATGQPVLLTGIDLVDLANVDYLGPDPDVDPDAVPAVIYALDMFFYRASEMRSVGGERARGMAYDLSRYVLPFLLEHRGVDQPILASRMRISDITTFVRLLAGENSLPASTIARDLLRQPGRPAVACHWLSREDAARVSGRSDDDMAVLFASELPVRLTSCGQAVIRAMDLRSAGLLQERDTPHGLARTTAQLSLQLLLSTWNRAQAHGVRMVGDPSEMSAKVPLLKNRQREPQPDARVYVPLQRCLEVAAALHPVHQRVLWEGRLAGMRLGEIFGTLVGDRGNDVLAVRAIGGRERDVRDVDGTFVRSDARPGTKGSREGIAPPGSRESARDLHQRTVPIASTLGTFLDAFDEVFHTSPDDGSLEASSRAIPGLREADLSGAQAFESALKRACGETAEGGTGPASFTAHDLRASLNTDLENAGADGRWLRHMFGHSSENGMKLDVHAARYDLGLDGEALAALAVLIEGLLPSGTDLRIPTNRVPAFGVDTLHARRSRCIEEGLLNRGWYVPGGRDGVGGLTAKVVAQRLGLSQTQVMRMLEQGRLLGRRVPRGRASLWLIAEVEVERELVRRQGTGLSSLAAQLGVTYHRVYSIVTTLKLDAGRLTGDPIYLDDVQTRLVADCLAEEARARALTMTHVEASEYLDLPVPLIQTLLRGKQLRTVGETGRGTRVTRESVEEYARAYLPCRVGPSEKVVPIADVRDVLAESRNVVSELVRTRRLAVVEIARRQYVGCASLVDYLNGHPVPGGFERLALLEVDQP